ncbi:deoxyribose-phosphate aldolase [Mesotoga prima]|uniref:deoxyribose-phosphate aldolase n=1 Tax=Mesotoga prima TaxID=1184387 RepID=UPI002C862B03|nr:deoxyribose-phosphate aldolase [Mesotoga prima]HQC15946.1 deoxyribose-phosphate aldolase [Mesotoga prima]
MSEESLTRMIDSTMLKPDATKKDIEDVCRLAIEYKFKTVAIGASWIEFASGLLKGSEVGIDAPVGFPNGYSTTESKVFEAKDALLKGASEIDMVINIGWLKSKMHDEVKKDIVAVRNATKGVILKVILEVHYLTEEEKRIGANIVADTGADFVKTSTGFADTGCTESDVKLLLNEVGNRIQVKASGGIRKLSDLLRYQELGATRFGASNAHLLIDELRKTPFY